MQNKLILLLLAAYTVFQAASAQAQIETLAIKSKNQENLKVTGFADYYPFGEFDEYNKYKSVFQPFLNKFVEGGNYSMILVSSRNDYENTIRKFSRGEGDLVLGMYNDTSLYKDMKYIYPAALLNPIHVVMLPSRIGELKSISDLRKMKGAIHEKEMLGDYMQKILEPYNLEKVSTSYDLYGKLITGEIDYIFTSLYFGTIETSKLGLRQKVAFSKQSLWRVPIFFGISKMSYHREYLSSQLTKLLEKQETRDNIQKNMIELVRQIEAENQGVVPPTYELQK